MADRSDPGWNRAFAWRVSAMVGVALLCTILVAVFNHDPQSKSLLEDFSATERVTVGSEFEGIRAMVRYEELEPTFLDMMIAGAGGTTLTYYPSLADSGTNYAFILVAPIGDALEMAMDSQRGNLGDHEIELELRREDGGNVDGLF